MRRNPARLLVILATLVSVTGRAGASFGSTSVSESEQVRELSPAALVVASIAAGDSEPSVRYTSVVSAMGGVLLRGTSAAGLGMGSQVATITFGGKTEHARVRLVDHAAYIEAGALSLQLLLGMTPSAASHEANQWIKILRSSTLYASTMHGLTVRSAMSEILKMQRARELPEQTILGQRVIPVVGTTKFSSGVPATNETVYVRATGRPLPVEVRQSSSEGQSLESFSSWGERISIRPPSTSIAISPSWFQKV